MAFTYHCKATREEMHKLVDETVKFYEEDPSRRAAGFAGDTCFYETNDGRHCAIGRVLTPQEHELVKKSNCNGFINVEELLARIGAGLPTLHHWHKSFLRDLQIIHDNRHFWSSDAMGLLVRAERVAGLHSDVDAGIFDPQEVYLNYLN